MNIVHGPSAGLVWRDAARVVLEQGTPVEDDGQMLREVLDVLLVVDDPEASDRIGVRPAQAVRRRR